MKRVQRVGKLLLLLFTSISIGSIAQAQPTFFIEDQATEAGISVEVPVYVNDFNAIIGCQFSLNWDAEVFEFIGFEQLALDITAENFGVQTEAGTLVMVYIDMALEGKYLDDGAVLFSIIFKPLTDAGTASEIAFSNVPAVQEVTDTTQQEVAAVFEGGTLEIVSGVSSSYATQPFLHFSEVSPNPFVESTTVVWNQRHAGTVTWQLFDLKGEKVVAGEQHYAAGENQLTITQDYLPSAGNYILRLQQQKHEITEKLIFIE